MRIAMVSEHASPLACITGEDAGGQNVHVAELATELARRGHEVVVYTRRADSTTPDRVPFTEGVRVEHLRAGPAAQLGKDHLPPHMPAFGRGLRRAWPWWRPDVVHAHFWMSGMAAIPAAEALDIPVLQTFHALGSVKRRFQGAADTSPPERCEVERGVARKSTTVVATSREERAELLTWAFLPVRPSRRSNTRGANRCARTVPTVEGPTQYRRRRGCSAAQTMARAATSGWYTGGTGLVRPPIRERTQENCGVLTAGRWTSVTLIRESASTSSARTESVNPRTACLAPQYAAWNGMPR